MRLKIFLFILLTAISGGALLAQSDPCFQLTDVGCGDSLSVTLNGVGYPGYGNYISGHCPGPAGAGGDEVIFRFIATHDLDLEITVTNVNGFYNPSAQMLFKKGNICDTTLWNCTGLTYTFKSMLESVSCSGGDTVLLLLNNYSSGSFTYHLDFRCIENPCSNITLLNCDTSMTIHHEGLGSSYLSPGVFSQGCISNQIKNGSESVFRVLPTTNSIYQFTVGGRTFQSGESAELLYHFGSYCDTSGWQCGMLMTDSLNGFLINANAGDTLSFVLNSGFSAPIDYTINFDCLTDTCAPHQYIQCNDSISFEAQGYGLPVYPINIGGTGCFQVYQLGGKEATYTFIAPSSCVYTLKTIQTIGSFAGQAIYAYKLNGDRCEKNGWTCFANIGIPNVVLKNFTLAAGDTLVILINLQSTAFTRTGFTLYSNGCCTPAGISGQEGLMEFNISSTSGNGLFYISGNCSVASAIEITATDAIGKTVFKTLQKDCLGIWQKPIDLTSQLPGVYFLTILKDSERKTFRYLRQ